ncbi:MAG: M20/M25/M40 family metallo-hydrolase [Anaerolineae bacterium]
MAALVLAISILAAACYPPAGPTVHPGLANPATQYCLDHGGTTRPRGYEGQGPSGLCVFPDDSVCDEWAFFRGECGPASQPPAEGSQAPASETGTATTSEVDEFLLSRLADTFVADTSALVEIQTYRDDSPDSEARVTANLQRIHDYLVRRVDAFNAGQQTLRLEPFDWQEEIGGVNRWVFGFRVGDGPRKFSMLTHMDTVPPGNEAWKPFEPRVEVKEYRDGRQPFLVGRGTVDDKGPGILALSVLESAARHFDGTGALDDWTLEVSFDTAEETDMSMRYYLDAVGAPELGIVFDAYWCVRAEKGIERPVFSVPLNDTTTGDLRIAELRTPEGAINQIPDQATARIEGTNTANHSAT